MHKYQPRVHVVKRKDNAAIHTLEGQDYRTFLFPETVFIGVTAYQNQLVSVRVLCDYWHQSLDSWQLLVTNTSSFI